VPGAGGFMSGRKMRGGRGSRAALAAVAIRPTAGLPGLAHQRPPRPKPARARDPQPPWPWQRCAVGCRPANPAGLCISPCLTEQERRHRAAADALSFSSSCCWIGSLTLRLTLAYFSPSAFPKAALVPGAS
jgi:hypothetical protein